MVRNCCGGNTTMPTIFSQTLATDLVSFLDLARRTGARPGLHVGMAVVATTATNNRAQARV